MLSTLCCRVPVLQIAEFLNCAMSAMLAVVIVLVGIDVTLGQCPQVPINIPGQPLDVEQAVGLWHEYMHADGSTVAEAAASASTYNLWMNATILGAYPSKGRTKSYYISWNYNGYYPVSYPATTNMACSAIFQAGNLTSDGKRQVVVNFGMDADELLNVTYTNLFTDYKLMQVLYRCDKPNADGKNCDSPFAWVHTRIAPPLLTATQKDYIKNAADYYLKPVCKKFTDLPPSRWDTTLTNLAPCNMAQKTGPQPPAKFKALMPVVGF